MIQSAAKAIADRISTGTILSLVSLIAGIFLLVTIILAYHWKKYIVVPGEGRRVKTIYYFIATFLWVIIILSALQIITAK
jgi:hypothetical protein